MVKRKAGKGGPRPGSGRPRIHAGGTKSVTTRLPMDIVEFIESTGRTLTDVVIDSIRNSDEYKAWLKSRAE